MLTLGSKKEMIFLSFRKADLATIGMPAMETTDCLCQKMASFDKKNKNRLERTGSIVLGHVRTFSLARGVVNNTMGFKIR